MINFWALDIWCQLELGSLCCMVSHIYIDWY